MIKELNNVDYAIEILVSVLKSQTELGKDYILNGKTHQGASLGRLDTETNEIVPFTPSDTFIVFDVNPDNETEISFTDAKENLNTYAGYTMRLIVYGDSSDIVSQKAVARIRSQEIRNYLQINGVYIEKVSAIESTDEYINNIMWCRADLVISFFIRYSFKKISVYDDITTPTLKYNNSLNEDN